jgi:hypothetical protein
MSTQIFEHRVVQQLSVARTIHQCEAPRPHRSTNLDFKLLKNK